MSQLGWVTPTDAARRARRSPRTIYRWMKDGTLEPRQIGKTWYVSMESLKEALGELATLEPSQRR